MAYQDEFPGFEGMPAIPAGFEDRSWHNDISPSFFHKDHHLLLWVDFLKPEEREFPEMARFTLYVADDDGASIGEPCFESDSWADMAQALKGWS